MDDKIQIAPVEEKQVDQPQMHSHYWLENSQYALCGDGPRKWSRKEFPDGLHPKRFDYPRCTECAYKRAVMKRNGEL